MRKAVLSLLLLMPLNAFAQSGDRSYYGRNDFLFASPGALKFGLYGYDNPALLSYVRQPDILFAWSDGGREWNDFDRWGLFTAVPNLGFGLVHQRSGESEVTDYRISVSLGDHDASLGIGYGWSTGDEWLFGRTDLVSLGTLFRPEEHLSVGVFGYAATEGHWNEGVLDIAVRPFGDELVTMFLDGSLQHGSSLKNADWSAGAAVEAFPGLRITGRYFDSRTFTVGIQFSMGNLGFQTQSRYDRAGGQLEQSYGVRLGAYDRTLVGTEILPDEKYLELNLNGPLQYQKYRFFDGSNTLSGILSMIKAAKEDPGIRGIAINTSGMAANREMLWEIREQLKDFKNTGKHVVLFLDRPNIDMYHFASVADKIILDPQGMIMLEGFLMGRTFFKGTLEKLGIGYEEWRFFKYKSAVENLSRDQMSDADREQRQKIVEDYYRLAKSDICQSRRITEERFDHLVNDVTLLLPKDAMDEGLIDSIGRWEKVPEVIASLENGEKQLTGANSLVKYKLPDDSHWSEKPRIAVVYALGECAMDQGINARSLSKVIEALAGDTKVKAVVLRVDSPGGDAMASDYVAEAVRKCKGVKPVIVSQGYVAASGGYWLSMYADSVLAAPNTITGSIGVIGGWMYNKGLKDTLGMSTDHVKMGKHADIGFGFTLPFIGVSLPDRNLTSDEFGKIETSIKTFYREFVSKVAAGRGKSIEDIEQIAQGRVWSGYDGLSNGLVDKLGGLDDAIRIAQQKSGIGPAEDVNIIEFPEKGLFDLSKFMPKLLPVSFMDDPVMRHLKFRLQYNGQPMPLLPLEETEFGPLY